MSEISEQAFAGVALRLGYLKPSQVSHVLAWRKSHPEAPPLPALCVAYRVMTPERVREVEEVVRSRGADSPTKAQLRSEALRAFVRGAVKALPVLGPVAGELIAAMENDNRKVPDVPSAAELETVAEIVVSQLPPENRSRLESLARSAVTATSPKRRIEAMRMLAAAIEGALSNSATVARADEDSATLTPEHAQGQAVFTVTDGPDLGLVFTFPASDGTFLIGRTRDVKVCLGDPKVSRQHCLVAICSPRARIRDLSRNGTFLNGMRIEEEADLPSGSEIWIGKTTLRFELTGNVNASDIARVPSASSRLAGSGMFPAFPGLIVTDVIGEGGQGVVYKAQRQTGEVVAIKTLRPDRKVREKEVGRFLREATLGAQVQHPNVVRVFGSGFHENVFYFVMEYVEGPDVERELERRGKPFSIGKGIAIVRQLMGGVRAAHDRGLVHRDIKPSNILLETDKNGTIIPKLTDFGLMRSFEGAGLSFTRTGQGRGTPAFMPPEQVEHAHLASPVSDIYSLGATLYFLVSREFPIDLKKKVHPLVQVIEGERIPLRTRLPRAPKALDELLSRCMSFDPEKRPGSIEELDRDLAAIAEKLPRTASS